MMGSGATPNKQWIFSLLALIATVIGASFAHAQSSPVDCSSFVTVTTANERSTLDRSTRETTSTADVTVKNTSTSAQSLLAPLRAVININNANGTVKMPEALVSTEPGLNGKFYYDLSGKLTNGKLLPGASIRFTVKFVRASTVRFTYTISTYAILPAGNQVPVAKAGPDQNLALSVGQNSIIAQLNGADSYDPDGTIKAFTWSGTPDPADIANPTVTLSEGTYTFSLVVTDSNGAASQPSTVKIIVSPAPNQAPVANAGSNRALVLPPGQATMNVQLDGSASSDSDGTIKEYIWSGTPTPAAIAKPTVALATGIHSFSLVVKDNNGASSAPSAVTITVATANPPQIRISSLQYAVNQGETLNVTLSANSPDARTVTLSASPALANASFTASRGTEASGTFKFIPGTSQLGTYLVSFRARDTLGLEDSETVQIKVQKVNHRPTVSLPETATTDEGKSLVIPVSAGDPDGDSLTLDAGSLPDNAVFMPSAGSITFLPDYTQAGSYTFTITASDGALSASSIVRVTVKDVTPGSGTTPLTMAVDPVESPNFLDTQRITGRINSTGSGEAGLKTALISGLNPAGGEQGAALSVTITGAADKYATHFEAGKSAASFGKGITVKSLAITGPTSATALIQIDAAAATGARQVAITTGSETALSVNAFSINKGTTSISGRLTDGRNPLANVTIVLQGTNLTVQTGADGSFSFSGVPSGEYTLLVNAPNHEMLSLPVNTQIGAAFDAGELQSKLTVFDPTAAPSVSMVSVVGRGATRLTFNIDRPEMRELITDTILLVGGSDGGILDEYGVQTNPELSGNGVFSLTQQGVNTLADRMLLGQTYSLPHLLLGASFAFKWSGSGQPLTLQEWLAGIQEMVNQAWNDPTNPDNYLPLLIFNSGNSLAPEPPTISFLTRLNALQAFLLNNSLIAYMQEKTAP
jgi:hypothetical protein